MKNTTRILIFLATATMLACNDQDPAPFQATEFYVNMEGHTIQAQTHATKEDYDNDLNRYWPRGFTSGMGCNDTALYIKESCALTSFKNQSQANDEIQFIFAKSFIKSEVGDQEKYELPSKLFGAASFQFMKYYSIFEEGESDEIFKAKTGLVGIELIDEHGIAWSSRFGDQAGSSFNISDCKLEPFDTAPYSFYNYSFILTGSFSCRLYRVDNPNEFKEITGTAFRIPIFTGFSYSC